MCRPVSHIEAHIRVHSTVADPRSAGFFHDCVDVLHRPNLRNLAAATGPEEVLIEGGSTGYLDRANLMKSEAL